jgi:multidrug efflux pump subunit AcrA (membrane-fusion protein)
MAQEHMGWRIVVGAVLCVAAGLAGGWRIAAVMPHAADSTKTDDGEDDEPEPLSEATLKTLGVTFGTAELTDWTRTTRVTAVVEAPPEVARTVRSPFGGRIVSIETKLGDFVRRGDFVVTVLRDPLPRPSLTLTGAILKPASDLHETVLELRARVHELDLARTELQRVEQYTAQVDGEDLPLIPLQRKIDLGYRVARAEAAVEQSRMEMEKHGLDESQINGIEDGGHLPQATGATWRRALEHNGVWTSEAEPLYLALPEGLREVPWVVGTIGELAGVGLATPELSAWLEDDARAANRILEVGVLLQRGHSLEDVQRLFDLGALEPLMEVKAPPTTYAREAWDVRKIHVQPGTRVEQGSPLIDLEDAAHMLLRLEPVGGEVAAVLFAKGAGAALHASPLVEGEGLELDDLRVGFIASTPDREGTVAYIEADNILLPSDDGRRVWGLRQGTRYTVWVPRESLEGVFVLPAEAVAEMGPDLVVFHREPSGVIIPIPLSVVHRDEQVVIVEPIEGLDLFPGDEIAVSGAFALSLAMRGGDAAPDHGHAQGRCDVEPNPLRVAAEPSARDARGLGRLRARLVESRAHADRCVARSEPPGRDDHDRGARHGSGRRRASRDLADRTGHERRDGCVPCALVERHGPVRRLRRVRLGHRHLPRPSGRR